ncbi:hypothetical protein A2U01_0070189, partial [Trifolium medium]|nr:hypothetical protein [Trifolium medium]
DIKGVQIIDDAEFTAVISNPGTLRQEKFPDVIILGLSSVIL